MELNRLAPDFELRGLGGRVHRLSDSRGRIVIVNFWPADCPHVLRADVYAAQVTPEVFVVDRAGVLRYRGAVMFGRGRERPAVGQPATNG